VLHREAHMRRLHVDHTETVVSRRGPTTVGTTTNPCVPEQCASAMKGEGGLCGEWTLVFMISMTNAYQRRQAENGSDGGALLFNCIQLVHLSAVAVLEPCLSTFEGRATTNKDLTGKIGP